MLEIPIFCIFQKCKTITAWKVFLVRIFPYLDWIKRTLYFDTFRAVHLLWFFKYHANFVNAKVKNQNMSVYDKNNYTDQNRYKLKLWSPKKKQNVEILGNFFMEKIFRFLFFMFLFYFSLLQSICTTVFMPKLNKLIISDHTTLKLFPLLKL